MSKRSFFLSADEAAKFDFTARTDRSGTLITVKFHVKDSLTAGHILKDLARFGTEEKPEGST